jgi:hypothetical protein
MNNPLNKIGKICFVKLKMHSEKLTISSEKWKIPSVEMENPLG